MLVFSDSYQNEKVTFWRFTNWFLVKNLVQKAYCIIFVANVSVSGLRGRESDSDPEGCGFESLWKRGVLLLLLSSSNNSKNLGLLCRNKQHSLSMFWNPLDSSCRNAVEHRPHNPKAEGSNLAGCWEFFFYFLKQVPCNNRDFSCKCLAVLLGAKQAYSTQV